MEYAVAFNDISLMLIKPGAVERVSHGLHQPPGRVVGHLGIFVNCDDVLYPGQDRYVPCNFEEAIFGSASQQSVELPEYAPFSLIAPPDLLLRVPYALAGKEKEDTIMVLFIQTLDSVTSHEQQMLIIRHDLLLGVAQIR
jgi:hypothetical protein